MGADGQGCGRGHGSNPQNADEMAREATRGAQINGMFWQFDWQDEGQLNGAEFAFNPRSTLDKVSAMKVQNRLSSSRRLLPSIPGSRNDGGNYRRRTHRRFCSLNRRNHFHRRENFRSRPPAAAAALLLRSARLPSSALKVSQFFSPSFPPLLCFTLLAPDSHHRHHRRRRHEHADHGVTA